MGIRGQSTQDSKSAAVSVCLTIITVCVPRGGTKRFQVAS